MSNKPVKLLYIEDDEGLARLLQKRLSRQGFTVETAHDGEEGLVLWREGSYDLIILDYRLPGMDGIDVLKVLAEEEDRHVPVIMVTGAGAEEVAVEAMRLHAADYIIKDTAGSYLELLPKVIERVLTTQRLHQEKERAEKSLERRTRELERSNAELQQFAYVASHDLQEPLRMISSYTKLLTRRYQGQLDDDAEEFMGYITDGVNRMRSLIVDLLEYSRVGTTETVFSPVNLTAILETVLADLTIAIQESGARVTWDTLPTVLADEGQMKQLLQNLVGNAIKYRSEDRAPEIHVSAEHRDGEWILSIRDNGIGIGSEYRERVFAIFQRLHTIDKYSGTGIGLAICKKIAERHGGHIWVESESNQGSTFFFALPDSHDPVI